MGFDLTTIRDGNTVLIKAEYSYSKNTMCDVSNEAEAKAILVATMRRLVPIDAEESIRVP